MQIAGTTTPKMIILFLILVFFAQHNIHAQNLSQIGDSVSIQVKANRRFTHTGLMVTKGETYQVYAIGKWRDAGFEPTDAGGFPPKNSAMRFARFLQPMHRENYMKLVAKTGRKHYAIGTSAEIHFGKSGRLILQPNDALFFFGNNSGTLNVVVRRVN
jgi:hypothetical protein